MQQRPWIVATERLGRPSPREGWRRALDLLPWETQTRQVYDIDPDVPTATCHLQAAPESEALCGYPAEPLTEVPGGRSWDTLEPALRCTACEETAHRQ
ncbi:hypothetical protein ACIO3O_17270 [Streptomyces sp. NPDC087440]|uniref:hypothetical protein n=1 Tax=Streptomyces sp. NPDC087440 TaxID=3365790 RepID=UPI0037F161DD